MVKFSDCVGGIFDRHKNVNNTVFRKLIPEPLFPHKYWFELCNYNIEHKINLYPLKLVNFKIWAWFHVKSILNISILNFPPLCLLILCHPHSSYISKILYVMLIILCVSGAILVSRKEPNKNKFWFLRIEHYLLVISWVTW